MKLIHKKWAKNKISSDFIFQKYHFIDQFYKSSTQNRLPVMFDSG